MDKVYQGKVISTKESCCGVISHKYEGNVKGIPFGEIGHAQALAEVHKNLMEHSEISDIEAILTFKTD